jgi:hypothetical protein
LCLEPRGPENSSTAVPSVYAAIQSYTVYRNWNSAYPGDSAATRGLAPQLTQHRLHRRRAIGFLDSGLADRARVAAAYCRGHARPPITYRRCLVSFEATLLDGLQSPTGRSALKSDPLSQKDFWLVFTSAEHNAGKSSCYSTASHWHFLPSEIFEGFFTM